MILSVGTASAFVPGGKPSTYNAVQGTIHLQALSRLVSQKTNTKAVIESIRWPLDPSAFIVYFETAGTYATYTVNLKVNDAHEEKCSFVINTETRYAFFLDCESPTMAWVPHGLYPLNRFMTEIKIPETSR